MRGDRRSLAILLVFGALEGRPDAYAQGSGPPNNPRQSRVAYTGTKINLPEYCGNTQLGAKPCGQSIDERGSLKKYLIDTLHRDIATLNILYYNGLEPGPVSMQKRDVPVCDLGRGLKWRPTGAGTKESPYIYSGGEGNFLENHDSAFDRSTWHHVHLGAGDAPEISGVQACLYDGYQVVEAANCTGRNWLSTDPNRRGVSNSNYVPPKSQCGGICLFREAAHNVYDSSGTPNSETALVVDPNSCGLEFAWVRGLWPRMVWSAATAPGPDDAQKLKIGSESFLGVFKEIEQGEIKFTTLTTAAATDASSPQESACAGLGNAISQLKDRVRDTEGRLRTANARMNLSDNQLICPSSDSVTALENAQSGLNREVLSKAGRGTDLGPRRVNEGAAEGNAVAARSMAVACELEAARYALYLSIEKVALCEVLSRARGAWEVHMGSDPMGFITSARKALDEDHCKDCSISGDGMEDRSRRMAAYAVSFRNWFVDNMLKDPTQGGRLRYPTKAYTEPPVSIEVPTPAGGH